MEPSEIISATLVGINLIGILVALYIGVTFICENRRLQKIESKNKLLEDLAFCVFEKSLRRLDFNIVDLQDSFVEG